MNLKDFKKVSCDEHSTILVHPRGHQIQIAHHALDKKTLEQLHAVPMAEGGFIDKLKAWASPAPTPMQGREHKPEAVIDKDKAKQVSDSFKKAFADGGEVAAPEQQSMMPDWGLGDAPAQAATAQTTQAPTPPMPDQAPVIQPAAISNIQLPTAQPQDTSLASMPDPTANLQKGIEMQQQGVQKEAKAIGEQGRMQATAAQEQANKQNELATHFQSEFQRLDSERAAILNDIKNQHIDANRYLNRMGTGQKVSTAIGLILGGIGSGLAGGENPALQFLNHQIDRDVQAQQLEASKGQNMLAALQHQFGNMRDATTMMKVIYNDMYAAKLGEAAGKTMDAQAQARAQAASGKLLADNAQLLSSLAQRSAVLKAMKTGQVDPAVAINSLVPEKDRDNARKELDKVNGYNSTVKTIKSGFQEMRDLSGAASSLPFTQSKARYEAIRAQIMGAIRSSMKGQGAMSDQEVEQAIEPLLPKRFDRNIQLDERENKLIDMLANQNKGSINTLKGWGIDIPLEGKSVKRNSNVTKGYNARSGK